MVGALDPQIREVATPGQWHQTVSSGQVADNWLAQWPQQPLQDWVSKALENNRALKQRWLDAQVRKQAVTVSGAALWPSLDAGPGCFAQTQ